MDPARTRSARTRLRLGAMAALLATGCVSARRSTPPRPSGETSPRPSRRAPAVRVSRFLRLARAGRVDLLPRPDGTPTLLARVAAVHRAPAWQRAVDSQGNLFRVAPDGRIVPDAEPSLTRQPASARNVAYYAALAIALLAQPRHRRQGLVVSAEILDLPGANPSVGNAQRWFCNLFARLGIVGLVRKRLYGRLVAVSHREGPQVVVRNHVFPFSVRLPVGWSVLAGPAPETPAPRPSPARPSPERPASLATRPGTKTSAPPAGAPPARRAPATAGQRPAAASQRPAAPAPLPRQTALVIAVPPASPGEPAAANLVWLSTRRPETESLRAWMKQRLAALGRPPATPPPRAVSVPPMPALAAIRAVSLAPLRRGGRIFSTLQVFFRDSSGVFHHASLYAPRPSLRAGDAALLWRLLRTFRAGLPPHPCDQPARR